VQDACVYVGGCVRHVKGMDATAADVLFLLARRGSDDMARLSHEEMAAIFHEDSSYLSADQLFSANIFSTLQSDVVISSCGHHQRTSETTCPRQFILRFNSVDN